MSMQRKLQYSLFGIRDKEINDVLVLHVVPNSNAT